MSKTKRLLSMLLVVALVAGIAISGTLAYLTSTDSDVNVMTLGNVQIEQHELQRADDVGHTGTAVDGSLEKFEQNQALYPAVPVNGAATDYSAEQTNLFKWGPYVTAEGAGNGLWNDEKLHGAMDKMVFVENTGKSACYYRTILAFECPEGMAYSQGADKEFMMNVNGHSNFVWEQNGYYTINGTRYLVMTATYKEILGVGETSRPSLLQVVMTHNATNEDMLLLGDTYEILALSQAVQTAGFEAYGDEAAKVALNTGFGIADETNVQIWFGDMLAENDNRVEIPADAVSVSDSKEFITALENGGNYKIDASFEVIGICNVSADTAFYNDDPANVITFAQDARLKTAENADLAFYGAIINGGGGYTLENGAFNYDHSKTINSDAILMAFAGSTLTLGKGTVIENVVSQYPAVAWAKGTADNRATIILDGAEIRNCAGGSGSIINIDAYGDAYIEEGTVIENNVSHSGHHGIMRIYYGSTLTVNGGEIRNNHFSGNGMIGLWSHPSYPNTVMYMNGGKISNNSYTKLGDGFYCMVYVHQKSQFVMNGGEISGNTITDGTINAINSEVEGAITINGGKITNNSNARNENKDALAAVCYPGAVAFSDGTGKVLYISDNADVSGTIYSHANLQDKVDKIYVELSDFLKQ